MEKSIETVYYCGECGSSHTLSMAWVNNRTGEIDEYIGTRDEEENNFCNDCEEHVRIKNLLELWEEFSEIEVNKEDEIEEPFLLFPEGTPKTDVWHWFDERCPNSLAEDLMGETSKFK